MNKRKNDCGRILNTGGTKTVSSFQTEIMHASCTVLNYKSSIGLFISF